MPPWMPCDDRQASGPSRSRFSQHDDSIVHKGVEMTDQDNGTWKGSNIIMARLGLFDWENPCHYENIAVGFFFNAGVWINLLYEGTFGIKTNGTSHPFPVSCLTPQNSVLIFDYYTFIHVFHCSAST